VDTSVEPQFAKGGIPGKSQPNEFVLTGFTVDKLPPLSFGLGHPASEDPEILAFIQAEEEAAGFEAGSFFGCPDATRTCNKLIMSFEGDLESFRFSVSHDPDQQFSASDSYLEDPTRAAIWWQNALPTLPMSGKESPLIVYWQGQRGLYGHYDDVEERMVYDWSLMPDLDVVGTADDRFVFGCAFTTRSGGLMCGRGKLWGYEDGWAEYHGEDAEERAFVVIDEILLQTEGGSSKPKKNEPPPSTYLRFAFQAFSAEGPFDEIPDYFDPSTQAASLAAAFRPIITHPSGRVVVADLVSSGSTPDSPTKPGIEKQRYRFGPFTEEGCHVLTLMGAYIHDLDALNAVWDPQVDQGPGMESEPIWVYYIPTHPTGSSMGRGDTCDPPA
jgi:hypothetical protein